MARILVGASAEVDVATKQDLETFTDRIGEVLGQLVRPQARYQRLHGARAPRAGNAPFIIKLDTPKPPTGWLWELQWALIMGDDPGSATALANVRAMIVVGAAGADAQLTAGVVGAAWGGIDYPGVIINGIAVPSPGPITIPDKNVVHTNEEVYAILGGTGTVAGAGFYHFTLGVLEKPQTAEALTW